MFKIKKIFQNKKAEMNFFNSYEEVYDVIPEYVYLKIAKRCNQLLKVCPAEILEVGCGSGKFGHELAKMGHKIIAIDLSDKMIHYAQKNKIINYCAKKGDVENSTLFLPDSFSLILCPGILHHLPSLEDSTAVENFYKWLKKDGHVVCWEPNGSNPIIRLSKLLFRVYSIFGGKNKNKYASINETNHTYKQYCQKFLKQNFQLIAQNSFFDDTKDKVPNLFFRFLINTRLLMIKFVNLILPFPYSGTMLFLIFIKK